jgi:hypothetical protein
MRLLKAALVTWLGVVAAIPAFAGDGSGGAVATVDTRYGPFGVFDHRSNYGEGVYPEPFLVDDSDLETGEFRLDWLHTKANDRHTDLFTGEIERGFGLVTLELEVPVERDIDSGNKVSGFDNVNVGARAPIYQYVSPSGLINTTFGTGIEVGIPTHSQLSKNAEVVPKVFNDLAVGDHFTLQSIAGYSMLYGPGEQGGLDTFEYGFVFGYTIRHKELPIPHVQQVTPVFELQGDKELNKGMGSSNELLGNAAVRFNLDAIGEIQPRLGVGFVFPLDNAGREEAHWGIYTSLVFEF